jgi:hypothetical protein
MHSLFKVLYVVMAMCPQEAKDAGHEGCIVEYSRQPVYRTQANCYANVQKHVAAVRRALQIPKNYKWSAYCMTHSQMRKAFPNDATIQGPSRDT